MADKVKILVVDDEKGFVQMLHDVLSPRGFEVLHAYNGEEALKAIETGGGRPPGLLILDVNMPVMSGIEFYNRILRGKQRSSIPTLIVTAESQMEDLFRDIGADGFLTKPFALGDLFSEVDSIIGRRLIEVSQRPKKVFLAENDAAAAYEIMSLFSEAGYELVFASTGFQAVEKAVDAEPDILLIKLNLEDVGGDETACKIREFRALKEVPIVLYSTDLRGYDPLILKKIVDKAGVGDVFRVSRPQDLLAEAGRLLLKARS